MTFNELINEAMAAASLGKLPQKNDEELNRLLSACRQHCASNPHSRVFDPTIDALRDEINRRSNEKFQIETKMRHEAAIGELHELKASVDQLAKPHWVLWATLIATAIAAVAGVILLFR